MYTTCSFLTTGLQFHSRCRLRILVKSSSTTYQEASLAEQRNVLHSRLRYWEELRTIYMPGLLQLQADLAAGSPRAVGSNIHPEDVELWLPSNIPPTRRCATCVEGLPEMENKLRMAQCYDGLKGIRHLLRVKARMVYFKNKNVRGQRDGTRSQAVIDRVHARTRLSAEKYRAT
jgi:hypothetical protein